MLPKHTRALLDSLVAATLSDSTELLRGAETARAERSVQGGLHGPIAVNAQILTLYDEYKRRAEAILACIQKVLRESSFRYYSKLDSDLQEFFLEQCSACSSDIETKLRSMPSGGKPTFRDFKRELHEKLLAEVSLAAESYLTHHKEVVRSWWVVYGKKIVWRLASAAGTIAVGLVLAWLIKKYID